MTLGAQSIQTASQPIAVQLLNSDRIEKVSSETDYEYRAAVNGINAVSMLLAAMAALIFAEWSFGAVSLACRCAADRLQWSVLVLRERWTPVATINWGPLIGGGVIVVATSWVINWYVHSCAQAVSAVTGIGSIRSSEVAALLVIFTGLSGSLVAVSRRYARCDERGVHRGIVRGLALYSALIPLTLCVLNGWLYYEYLKGSLGGHPALLGSLAGLVISVAETIAFYFATEITLDPVSQLLIRAFILPIHLSGAFCSLVGRLFETVPRRAL